MAYQTVNPYDNQIVATFDDLTDEQAMDLLAQAQKTFESWSQTSFAERSRRHQARRGDLPRTVRRVRPAADPRNGQALQPRPWVRSSSAPRSWTTTPRTPRFSWPPSPSTPPAPMTTPCWSAHRWESSSGCSPGTSRTTSWRGWPGPNLMAGNVVIVKHASNVPQAAAAFEKLLLEAGAPAGVLHQSCTPPRIRSTC